MIVRWSGEVQVNIKSQSKLDIGGRETCFFLFDHRIQLFIPVFLQSENEQQKGAILCSSMFCLEGKQ